MFDTLPDKLWATISDLGRSGVLGSSISRRAARPCAPRLLGLAGVVADVTVAELGGFKAMNEATPEATSS